ncbi:hypothetical protein P4S68_11605 [Pseudoalteromonas sp. Hal099]
MQRTNHYLCSRRSPPYHFINENNEPDGALVDLAKATIKHTKLSAKFEIIPMARIFYNA